MFWDKENKKKLHEVEKQIAERQTLYRRVFDTEDGKAVLNDLKKRCFVSITTIDDNPARMGFNEGRRSIYAMIDDLLNKDLQEIVGLLAEG